MSRRSSRTRSQADADLILPDANTSKKRKRTVSQSRTSVPSVHEEVIQTPERHTVVTAAEVHSSQEPQTPDPDAALVARITEQVLSAIRRERATTQAVSPENQITHQPEVDISTTTLPTEITDKERTTIDSVEPLTRGRVTPSDSHTAMTTLPNETTIGQAKTRGSVTHPDSNPGVWLGIGAGVLCVVASVVLLTVYFIRRTSGAVNNSKKPPDAQPPCSTQIPVDIPPTNPTNDYVHQGPEAEYDCAAEYTIDPTIPNIQEEPFKLRQNPLILAATSRGQIASHTAPVTGEPDTDMDEYELHMLENGIYGDAATTGGEIMAVKNVSS